MKIGLILRPEGLADETSVMAGMRRLLTDRGADVGIIRPDKQATDLSQLRVEHDLYVLQCRSELSLSLAGALDALGARILNSYRISAALRDKIVATQMLEAAGVAIPRTYVTEHPADLAPLLHDGPLVLKPYRGAGGRGVRVIWKAEQLETMVPGRGPLFAQRYHEPEGRDRKIYAIGRHIFGVKRVWPAETLEQRLGEPFAVTGELRDLTLRCGRAFGIEVFGIDVVISQGRAYVVDASSFPGFKGVPDAARHLAAYVYDAATRVVQAEPRLRTAGAGGG